MHKMKGYITNIEQDALGNSNFRRVLYTAKNCQLVLMSLEPGEEIGEEVHQLDQFFRVEKGEGKVIIDDVAHSVKDGFAIIIPVGTSHNLINTGDIPMKLYTLYSPPNHRDGIVHETKAEAEADEERFDGEATETQ